MRLFSEKVTPTFTSSNQNILTIKDFNEIFFDVYELEINGSKYIAEKISEYKGNPVVNIPIVIDGRELEAPFVIQRGDFEVIFNESNSTFIKVASSETEEVFIEEKNRDEEVEEIIFEKKESILEEIKQARQAATKFAESVQLKTIRQEKERTSRDKEVLAETASNFKKVLLEEFLSIAENTREELFTYNQQENEKTYEYITDTVDRLAEKLTQDLNEEIASQHKSVVEKFEKDISSLAQNILTDKLLKEIAVNNSENIKTADIRFETVSKTLAKVLSDHEVHLDIKIKKALGSYETHITALEQSNVELNDSITKHTNKALSRIGNVKTQLEESIDSISLELVDKITLAESKIKDYYDDRITLIESSVTDIAASDKSHILELIEESKQSILKEVNEIKISVPALVTERTLEPKGDDGIKKIKTDLEKSISNRFTQELANIRRVIELSSGGGSVAQQFANGGTMNGSLTVTGTISASQYLGIPVYTDTDTLSTVTGRGNTTTDSITVGGVTVLGGLTADRIFTNNLEALSANITVIDIKQYELSGFNVQGDATIQGSISASGNIAASSMTISGNPVATVVDPVRTTLTGNGILSTFAISGANNIINPSALIVAIDGALQEPVVDYTVSGGSITFTEPLDSGAKAVVISPTNTLQVSQMIPTDGSVTSAKLDNSINVAGELTVAGQPSLSALSDNHVITKGLYDDYFLGFGPKWKSWQIASSTNDGAAFNNSASDQILNWTSAQAPVSPFLLGGDTSGLSFDNKVFMLEMVMSRIAFGNSSAVFWFVVGEAFNKSIPVTVPNKKGFGFKATSTGISLWVHDGTNFFEGSQLAYTSWLTAADWKLSYYNGQISGYLNSSVIPSLIGGPTGSVNTNNHVCSFQITNGGGVSSSGFGFHNIRSLAYRI